MHLGFNLLFLIPGETGGRETYARELIEALYGVEPTLRATAFVNRDVDDPGRRELAARMRVVRLPVSARRPGSWAAGEIGVLPLSAAHAGVDVLHSMANFGPGTGRFRRVLTLHDLQYRALGDLMPAGRRLVTGALVGLAARRAARIITVSASAGKELRTLTGLDADRIAVIPNGVRPAPVVSDEAVQAVRRRLAIGSRPVALTVASHLPHKNLPLVFAALATLEPAQRPVAVLAGHATDAPSLAAAAHQARVADDVRLLGSVSEDELEALYALASCLLLPTRYEGFGLPALEAMVRGVPVVCSDIAPLREITGDAAIRFGADRAADAAAAVVRVLHDPELAARLVATGRERARVYSWRSAAEATLEVYRGALTAR